MLSSEDQKRLEYVKDCFQTNNFHDFSNNDVQELQDLLKLLCVRGVLQDLEIDGANAYRKTGDFQIFENWLDDATKEVNNNGLTI